MKRWGGSLHMLLKTQKNIRGMKKIKRLKKMQMVIGKWQSVIYCLLLIAYCQLAKSQQTINLQTAIETAFKNNLTLKSEKQKSDYQQKLIKTSANIPLTNFMGEYGQINSIYADNRFGVSQSFNFPTVYTKQKNLLTEEWKAATLELTLKESELKKAVTEVFYTFLYLKEKELLLLKSDTIYSEFFKKAELRLAGGESNVLETTTAETQRGNIILQLKQLQQEEETVLLQFQLLLNTETEVIPNERNFKMEQSILLDSNLIIGHPALKIIEQQKKISNAAVKLEKSKLLPDINLGYYNMSMRGNGADNVLYSGSSRFQSAQLGIGVPLFFKGQKAKIASAKVYQSYIENNYLLEKQVLKKRYQTAYSQYKNQLAALNYFEQKALPNSKLITETANKQFINGEINYLDWVMLINQSISIKSNYIDAVRLLNETIIQLNYLTSK